MNKPQINYRFLDQTPSNVVFETFTLAFADYSLPMRLTEEQWLYKLKNDRIDWSVSIGAFDGEDLVGVILHGKNDKDLYNAGTGVIPSHRGQNITSEMYLFALPFLKLWNYQSCILEVLSHNEPARKSYEKIGFVRTTVLNCYQGNIAALAKTENVQLRELTPTEYKDLYSKIETLPTWQNDDQAVLKNWEALQTKCLFMDQAPIGFIVYNSLSNKILQLFIEPAFRRKGHATNVLKSLFNNDQKILITNVNTEAIALNSLFTNLNLDLYIQQDQMKLTI